MALAAGSMASYAYLFTWEFALMIMTLIFIHESGHVWAMRRMGMKIKGFYFIPFLGGAAVPEEEFPSRKAEFFVAIMGPIWGMIPAILAGIAYYLTSNALFAAAASWMAMVNLFNLLPINPLDGGRIMKSIAFSIHSKAGFAFLSLGVITIGVYSLFSGIFLLFLLLILGILDLIFEWKMRDYGNVPLMHKADALLSGFLYIALIFILWEFMKFMKHVPAAEMAMEILKG